MGFNNYSAIDNNCSVSESIPSATLITVSNKVQVRTCLFIRNGVPVRQGLLLERNQQVRGYHMARSALPYYTDWLASLYIMLFLIGRVLNSHAT